MKNKFLKLNFIIGGGIIFLPIISMVSCSQNSSIIEYKIDEKLKSHFLDWYNEINKNTKPWNKKNNKFINYYCESEAQAITLYANYRGWYWNEDLHRQREPKNQIVDLLLDPGNPHEIRGSDYLKISSALNKATFPYDYTVYHGVEYMEDEFYDQLKDYIENSNGTLDYSKAIGREIESYGFFSTSLSKKEAIEYCDGWNWVNNGIHLPLKEKFVFVINIPKNYKGAVYLADFNFAGSKNQDNQVLINKNCKFKINKFYKENDINFWEMDLIIN